MNNSLGQKHCIYVRLFFLLFCMTLIGFKSSSQNTGWPPKEWKDTISIIHAGRGWRAKIRTFYGSIVLKNGDTLRGYIRPWTFDCNFLEQGKFDSVFIMNYAMSSIRGDVASLGQNFIVLKNIEHNGRLWRLVKQENKVIVYDFPDYLNLSSFGIVMLLVSNDKLIKIFGSRILWTNKKDKNKLILEFINKRYNTTFSQTDFKTGMEMIDYILQKENENK